LYICDECWEYTAGVWAVDCAWGVEMIILDIPQQTITDEITSLELELAAVKKDSAHNPFQLVRLESSIATLNWVIGKHEEHIATYRRTA
jgi:hypothetical protein